MGKLRDQLSRIGAKIAPKRAERKRMNEAILMLQSYPETRFLLELAQAGGIGVVVDKSLAQSQTAGVLRSDRESGQQYIALAPFDDATDLALTLIHELRHVWQDTVLGLTAQNRGISEPDAETHLILRRIKEADAHAFVNLMSRRMRYAQADMAEANGIAGKLVADTGRPLTESQQQAIVRHISDKAMSRVPDEEKQMIRDFAWALENLDSYDREAMVEYHLRYTSPQYPSQRHEVTGRKFDVPALRKMLRLGVVGEAPLYFSAVDDDALRAAVLQDVDPKIKRALGLMQAFEKAARRGILKEREEQQYRYEIETRLAEAVNRPPKPKTPSLYGPEG